MRMVRTAHRQLTTTQLQLPSPPKGCMLSKSTDTARTHLPVPARGDDLARLQGVPHRRDAHAVVRLDRAHDLVGLGPLPEEAAALAVAAEHVLAIRRPVDLSGCDCLGVRCWTTARKAVTT